MIENRVVIEGTVSSIGEFHTTKKGDRLRDFFITAEGKRLQYYCLTQYTSQGERPIDLEIGSFYRFEGYVNGMRILAGEIGEVHVNKIIVSKQWKPA